MASENVETVQRFLARINDGNLDAALADIAPEADLDRSRSDPTPQGWRRRAPS